VTVRKLYPLAVAFGLWAAGPAPAQEQADTAAMKAANQKLADAVAEKLKSAGVAKGAKLEIETRSGLVELKGVAGSDQQYEEILATIKTVPGIRRIESNVQVAGSVQPTGGQVQGGVGPVPGPGSPYSVAGLQPGAGPVAMPGMMPMPTGDPVPLNGMPAMAPVDPAGPRLPPYAWPTYAPYNNYSRVAYPESYPYNAFPYIGPYYPFPRVPLGWRKVVLEWEDGHWYYGKLSSPHDQWRVRFW
jgi:BON domain